MVLSDMVRGCVRGCVEELWLFFVPCAYFRKGAGSRLTNKHNWGGEGKKYQLKIKF
jgi:hypothetical protein